MTPSLFLFFLRYFVSHIKCVSVTNPGKVVVITIMSPLTLQLNACLYIIFVLSTDMLHELHLFLFKILLHLFIYCVYMYMNQHVWRSEDSFQVSVPSFHYVGLKLSQSCEFCKF